MVSMTTVAARNDFSTLVNRVSFGKERILLERRGKAVAAVVPLDDIELLRAIEDERDLADALRARAEARRKGTISLETLKADLGI